MGWYFRACPACRGDLCEDPQDRTWATCILCSRSYKVREIAPGRPVSGVAIDKTQVDAAA
jgi:hypothetical protein